MSSVQLARIVGAPSADGGPALTRGTKVLLPDGSELKGVSRIVLTAEPDDVWRAQIDCMVQAPDLDGVCATVLRPTAPTPTWWKRFLAWSFRPGKDDFGPG